MARKFLTSYLMKTSRAAGWLLVVLMPVYVVTGFSMGSIIGMNKVVEPNSAKQIHLLFAWPLVATVVVHSSITVYFAMRRWGWINVRRRR